MPRVLSLGTLFLVVALAAPLKALAGTKDMASAVLEGRRVSYLVCELINKSGSALSSVVLTLKKPDGNPIGSPFSCPTLAIGETCALEHPIGFPDLDLAVYCHAQLPKAFVRGGLRLLDRNRNTLAASDLEADLHGKIARLQSGLASLLAAVSPESVPPLVIAFTDTNSNDTFDPGDILIAKLVDADRTGAPSTGDVIVPGRYPLDFTASSTGRFLSGPIICNTVGEFSNQVFCTTTMDTVTMVYGNIAHGVSATSMSILDHIGSTFIESIKAQTGSLLDPETGVDLMRPGSPADDDFLDVIKLY